MAFRRDFLLAGLVALCCGVGAMAADLSALARLDAEASGITDQGDGIALDLAISQPVPFRVMHLDNPQRLVVDFREVGFRLLASRSR